MHIVTRLFQPLHIDKLCCRAISKLQWCVQTPNADTAQSFAVVMGLAGQAGVEDAWAAPVLQSVCLLQRHLDAEGLAALQPSLLRLQQNDQVDCAPTCFHMSNSCDLAYLQHKDLARHNGHYSSPGQSVLGRYSTKCFSHVRVTAKGLWHA